MAAWALCSRDNRRLSVSVAQEWNLVQSLNAAYASAPYCAKTVSQPETAVFFSRPLAPPLAAQEYAADPVLSLVPVHIVGNVAGQAQAVKVADHRADVRIALLVLGRLGAEVPRALARLGAFESDARLPSARTSSLSFPRMATCLLIFLSGNFAPREGLSWASKRSSSAILSGPKSAFAGFIAMPKSACP